MSFSKTSIEDLPVGTFVNVIATTEAMRLANGYAGSVDKGDVKVVGLNRGSSFKVEGEVNSLSTWMDPDFVEVVTGFEFDPELDEEGDEMLCVSSDLSFWTVGDKYEVSYSEECDCGCGSGGDELGLVDDDGDHDSDPSSSILFINTTRIKREMTETSVTTAVAAVDVTPEPIKDPLTPFSEMSDEDKAELLLAKHEGKPIQIYVPFMSAWRWVEVPTWTEHFAYRLEPSATTELRLKAKTLSEESDEAWTKLNNLNKAA